jgi:hypothetical protein
MVCFYVKYMKKEVKESKWNYCKPQNYKWVKLKQPRWNGKAYHVKYKRVKCWKEIPLKKYPMHFLEKFWSWLVDGNTDEAIILDIEEKELARIYDPMTLINFTKWDLEILDQNQILYHKDWETEAMQY